MSTELPNVSNTKRLVLDFFDLAFVKREPAQAAERYLGASYTQHNPTAPDGVKVFPELIGGLFAQAPQASFHLKRAIAEDDLVVLHYNMKLFPDDLGQASPMRRRTAAGRIGEEALLRPSPRDR